MERHCARPGCSEPATATFNFDGLRRIVWLGPLDLATGRSAGDLCQRHADRMRPPQHWELQDLRGPEPVTIPAPTRIATKRPAPASAEADTTREGEPSTPLLARAFRASKAG
jgi:hypothetical protein